MSEPTNPPPPARAMDLLAGELVQQVLDGGGRTFELDPFMDLVSVETAAELCLFVMADDGLEPAMLRRLVSDCRRMRGVK